MALFTPSESPAVVVKEVDLSGVVPNVQTTTGATVGNFRWGPVGERKLISNETELVNTYSSPDSSNTIDFHSASMFLKYSNSMFVTREVTSAAMNAGAATKGTFDSDGATGTTTLAQLVKGKTDFDTKKAGFLSQSPNSLGGRIRALARFPGELGNSIAIHTLTAGDSATMSGFTISISKSAFPMSSIPLGAGFIPFSIIVLLL